MEVEEIIQHIFGEEIDIGKVCQEDTSSPLSKRLKCLNEVRQWVKIFLDDLGPSESSGSWPLDKRQGRIGPANVRFDISTHVGLFVIGADRLSINSQSNFSTIRANVCLYQGKWQYEVQLGSKGVMQIGWATHDCKFSQEIGVGDTSNSYAYDGNRVRKWNVSTHKYGEPWLSGDIIGCTVDLDVGLLEFYRNGRSLGVAFDNIQMGPGIAYFPSVSLAFTENLVANFGSTPLKYPVTGCSPIQDAPFHEVKKAELLCKWLSQLLMLFDRKYEVILDNGSIKLMNDPEMNPGFKEKGFELPDIRLLRIWENLILGQSASQTTESISNQGFLMGLARIIFNPLAPLIQSPYVSEACFVPFLENLCNLTSFVGHNKSKTSGSKKRRLMLFLDLMWAFFEEHELKKCMENIITCLLAGFRHVPFVLEYPRQKHSLILLTHLCQHSRTRQFLLENVLFDKVRFANFVHVKPLDEAGLAEVVNKTWWESDKAFPSIEENKTAYFASCQRIRDAISEVETLQVDLLKTLLDNNDGSATQPSSRKIFLRKFRTFLHENLLSSRTLPLLQTPLPITLCCFHRLLVTFRSLWEREVGEYPIVVTARTFYDGSINYHHIDRLGGVLSHLNKTLRTDIVRALGSDHPVVAALDTPANQSEEISEEVDTFIPGPSISIGARFEDTPANFMIPVLARMLTQQHQSSGSMLVERMSQRPDKAKGGSLDSVASLIELLDGLVLFYHVAAHKQIAKVSVLRESMAEYTGALCSLKTRLDSYTSKVLDLSSDSSETEIVKQLQESSEVFEQKLSEQARHMAWVRAAVYSPEKQSHLAWLLRVILQTVKLASQEGELFAFVPDFYLDSLVEICTALRMYMHPTAPIENIEGYEDLLIEVSEFLCDHFSDPRIVHANSKDTLTQALASFVCSPTTLMALERVPYASQMKMVKALLRPYENRAWAQSNWVLVRMWQGCGFAFRYQKSPHLLRKLGPKLLQVDSTIISQSIKPCPSELFQSHIREVMLGDEPLATQFLNSLLNQLNWAFSEFIGMLQEIQNVSSRPARVFIESRQLKICATCFDLAIALLRVLEMVTSIVPAVFTDESRNSSDLLLGRLCQLMCQILNRVSSQAGCFQHVVMLEIPDLETIDHFPILTAVVGILLALLKEEMKNFNELTLKVPKVTKALVMEPSFQLDSLKFVLGNIRRSSSSSSSSPKAKPFSFQNYEDDVTSEEIEKVKRMISLLDFYRGKLSEVTMVSEDELCTICYAYSISATFLPCNHHSCRTCIAHHLMNSKDCFFCKAPIETVIDLDGKVLHDLTINNS